MQNDDISVSFVGFCGDCCSFAIIENRANKHDKHRGSVAELAYAADLKSAAARLVGSSPTAPTKEERGFQTGFDLWWLRVGRDSNR